MKSPVLQVVTDPHRRIEATWRSEYEQESVAHDLEREQQELRRQAWREEFKRSCKQQKTEPLCPVFDQQSPKQRRLLLTDATYEKLHEILSDNAAGVLVARDELTGWLADLEKQGRESERGFYLQSWNGDAGFSIDRIGRGSIYVPAVCVSLFGNIQPSRLRSYLSDAVAGGPTDDGLFQRFR
jgi:putative DNA primase/helicase